ncbi:MAG TPA: hypothetical protein VGE86_00195 [Thermoanaerobaculia bacterium]
MPRRAKTQLPEPIVVDEAVRSAETKTGATHLHAEPHAGIWEILGDVDNPEQRDLAFDEIRERLGAKNVVNSIRLVEPKRRP